MSRNMNRMTMQKGGDLLCPTDIDKTPLKTLKEALLAEASAAEIMEIIATIESAVDDKQVKLTDKIIAIPSKYLEGIAPLKALSEQPQLTVGQLVAKVKEMLTVPAGAAASADVGAAKPVSPDERDEKGTPPAAPSAEAKAAAMSEMMRSPVYNAGLAEYGQQIQAKIDSKELTEAPANFDELAAKYAKGKYLEQNPAAAPLLVGGGKRKTKRTSKKSSKRHPEEVQKVQRRV